MGVLWTPIIINKKEYVELIHIKKNFVNSFYQLVHFKK